jgi:hypothetical protein
MVAAERGYAAAAAAKQRQLRKHVQSNQATGFALQAAPLPVTTLHLLECQTTIFTAVTGG